MIANAGKNYRTLYGPKRLLDDFNGILGELADSIGSLGLSLSLSNFAIL